MNTLKIKNTVLHTWLWIIVMIGIILGVGYFAFIVVADKGKPTWDYRPVNNLPSETPYGIYKNNPFGQHVRGKEGK